MGWFFNSSKKIAGRFFNFRVDQWVDYDNIKANARYIVEKTKFLFLNNTASNTTVDENFEEAQKRLNLSEEALILQAQQYKRFTIFFLLLSLCIFIYFVFLIWVRHNYMGACMAFALTLYGLSQAIRYHFWYFQIQKRKLGCTFQEWWSALFKRGP